MKEDASNVEILRELVRNLSKLVKLVKTFENRHLLDSCADLNIGRSFISIAVVPSALTSLTANETNNRLFTGAEIRTEVN